MELPKDLKDNIWEFCRINNISNVDEFTIKMVKQGFTVEKYGASPYTKEPKEPEVIEKEVIREVIKEVPVEKIVEKEIIKTVEVEKEVYISDDSEINKLTDRISELERELDDARQNLDDARRESRQNLDEKDSKIGALSGTVTKLKKELDDTKLELDEEKKKEKTENNDIYGDDKKGFFGSNLSDLWKKK